MITDMIVISMQRKVFARKLHTLHESDLGQRFRVLWSEEPPFIETRVGIETIHWAFGGHGLSATLQHSLTRPMQGWKHLVCDVFARWSKAALDR